MYYQDNQHPPQGGGFNYGSTDSPPAYTLPAPSQPPSTHPNPAPNWNNQSNPAQAWNDQSGQSTFSSYQSSVPSSEYVEEQPAPIIKDHTNMMSYTPVYRDVWAAVLFLVHLFIFVAVSLWGAQGLYYEIMHPPPQTPQPPTPMVVTSRAPLTTVAPGQLTTVHVSNATANQIHFQESANKIHYKISHYPDNMLGSITEYDPKAMVLRTALPMLVISVALAALFLFAAYKLARLFIVVAWWAFIILLAVGGVFLMIAGGVLAGGISLFCALMYALAFLVLKRRIPLATVMLQTSMHVISLHPLMLLVSLFSALAQLVALFLLMFALAGISNLYQKSDEHDGDFGLIFAGIYLVFSYFWTSQVITNVAHCTCSGVYATYYFLEGSGKFIQNVVSGAARRASTYSFGSVCFGSLLLAVIKTLRFCAHALRNQGEADRNVAIAMVGCVCECFYRMLETLVEYFNRYAFTHVAIYGKPYVEAAKDTWRMIKSKGVDAIINDSLIDTFLSMSTLFIAILCFLIGWTLASAGNTVSHDGIGLSIALGFVSAFLGVLVLSMATTVIDSGVATTFVCLAEDPFALRRSKPDLYEKFAEVYPTIMERVTTTPHFGDV